MTVQLFGLGQTPPRLPIWHSIVEDLGNPSAASIASALEVGVRTVYRWNSTDQPPRAAALALFWLTRWGRSQIHAQAVNDALIACGYVDALRLRIAQLERQLAYLAALDTGAANEPLLSVLTPPAGSARGPGRDAPSGSATGHHVPLVEAPGVGQLPGSSAAEETPRPGSRLFPASGSPQGDPDPDQLASGLATGCVFGSRPM